VVQDAGRGKLRDTGQVLIIQIVHWVQAAASEDGILDTGGEKVPVAHLQIQVIQSRQQTVRGVVDQLGQMLPIGVVHGAPRRLHEPVPQVSGPYGPVPLRQGLRYGVAMFLSQLPQVGLPRPPHRAGVRHIKDVLQAGTAPPVLPNQGDALCAGSDPAAHGAVPQLHAGAGGGVRALGVDQQLVFKGVFV